MWNRDPGKARALTDTGAEACDSPAEAVAGADVVLTMVFDADAAIDVVREAAPPAGTLWLQSSTVGVEGVGRTITAARELGLVLVDCPVLGTKEPAEKGALVMLASGPAETRERLSPVLDALGSKTLWVGEAGAGSRLKLVTNNWIVGLLGVLAETVAFANSIGVDPSRFLETIEGGPLGLPYAQLKGNMMIEEDFPTSFSAKLARKDAGLVLGTAEAHDLQMPIAEAVAARFDEAIQAGHGEEDIAAVYRAAKV
jgi:3-hydroxyisobutyrate dehydrogenase